LVVCGEVGSRGSLPGEILLDPPPGAGADRGGTRGMADGLEDTARYTFGALSNEHMLAVDGTNRGGRVRGGDGRTPAGHRAQQLEQDTPTHPIRDDDDIGF